MEPWVVFDANGTLFDLSAAAPAVGGETALEAWFERTLHGAAALTLANAWAPFAELARTSLATAAARLGLEVDADGALRALGELPAFPDAAEAVEAAGERVAILTNSGRETARGLVERAGLPIGTVLSCEEVRAYKPSPAPYRLAREQLGDCVLVAAHAWDVVGARAAGLRAVWVDRAERVWPLAGVEPGERAGSLPAAVAAARSG